MILILNCFNGFLGVCAARLIRLIIWQFKSYKIVLRYFNLPS